MPKETRYGSTELTLRSVNRDKRTIDFVASTFAIDSYGTRIDPDGWTFATKIPITWAHDDRGYTPSGGRPIGRAINLRVENGQLLGTAEFPKRGIFQFADEVYDLAADGFIPATSVGFQPIKEEMTMEKGQEVPVYRQQKLLEIAFVTIPSNDEAQIQAKSRMMNRESEIDDIQTRLRKVEEMAEELEERIVPPNVSTTKAPEGEEWSAPALKDFTDKEWSDLSDEEKNHIAGHYAWAKEMPPATFGDLKLPHHDPKTGDVNFKGVAAAAARLDQSEIPAGDLPKVKAHLRAHYEQFGKDVPAALEDGKEDPADKAKEEKSFDLSKYSPEFIEKCVSYFEVKQPANKASTRFLDKWWKLLGKEQPSDEKEAWEQMEATIEQAKEVQEKTPDGTPEAPTPTQPTEPVAVEAPPPARKASVQVPLSFLKALPSMMTQAYVNQAVEALRQGTPIKDAVESIGR
jgi:HK97 family phage prohead protease